MECNWLEGGLQTAGAFVSAGGCEFVAPCILAGYLGVSGYDNAVAGYSTLVSGKPTATWGARLLEKTGLSPEVAELLYASTQLVAATGATGAKVAAPASASGLPEARLSYTQEPFVTHGLDATADVMQTPQAQALVNEYIKKGADPLLADYYAKTALASGKLLPEMVVAGPVDELIKLVPKNAYSPSGSDAISARSPFFVAKDEYLKISRMSSLEVADYLGLPAQQGVRGAHLGFDAYSMSPNPGQAPIIFKSEVAPISQGQYSAGGLNR